MTNPDIIVTMSCHSPCGELMLGSFDEKLCMCDWQDSKRVDNRCDRIKRMLRVEFSEGASTILERAAAELDEYFAGERREFDVPLLFAGSDFQKSVWTALSSIPYGTTVTYGALSRLLGKPGAVRAVANAVGGNALSIFVPCHRVIGCDGSLTGYSGGLEAKRHLLQLEGTL